VPQARRSCSSPETHIRKEKIPRWASSEICQDEAGNRATLKKKKKKKKGRRITLREMEPEKGRGWHSRRVSAEVGRDFEGEISRKFRSFSNRKWAA